MRCPRSRLRDAPDVCRVVCTPSETGLPRGSALDGAARTDPGGMAEADDDLGDTQVADAGLGDCWAITGGAGHVGLELGLWLARRGVAVRALDLAPPPPDGLDDGIGFVPGDVTDAAAGAARLAARSTHALAHALFPPASACARGIDR